MVNDSGVHRIRVDDVDSGGLRMFTTCEPMGPRLLNGPYPRGGLRAFAQRTAEWNPVDWALRGESSLSAVDTVLEASEHVMVAGRFETLGIERKWDASNPHNVQSFHAAGTGASGCTDPRVDARNCGGGSD